MSQPDVPPHLRSQNTLTNNYLTENVTVGVGEECDGNPALSYPQNGSDITLFGALSQSAKAVDARKQYLNDALLLVNALVENKLVVANPVPDEEPSPEPVQEAKITRIPPEDWRKVKKGRNIDPEQSVLLVSSKANVKTNLRKGRKTTKHPKPYTPEKKPVGINEAADGSERLDVPYRLAINSNYLLEALGQWIGPELCVRENVLVRPFKYLVVHEQEIRQSCNDLESLYEQAEAEAEAQAEAGAKQEHETTKKDLKNEKETAREAADRARRERDEFRCLIEFMDRDMADIFDIKRQIIDKTLTEIAFEHLWQLFRPGHLAYRFNAPDDGSRCQAYRILHVTGGRVCFDTGNKSSFDPVGDRKWEFDSETEEACRDTVSSDHDITSFLIDCFYIDFDGRRVGPRPKRLAIERYSGTRPIKLLPIYPAFLHPDDEQIQAKLITRGKPFLELALGSHKRYDGNTFRETHKTSGYYNGNSFVIERAEVHNEVIVDQTTGVEHLNRIYGGFRIKLGGSILLNPTESNSRETFDPFPEQEDNDWVDDVVGDPRFELGCRAEFLQSTDLLNFRDPEIQELSDDCLMLLPPRLYGYSLQYRKWFALDINCITEIPPWSDATRFEDLVLPEGHRMLLQALVKNHVRVPKQSSVAGEMTTEPVSLDVVAGKGKGLIILLHGVPGVGKTSTAECVAAELKRPLLPITCGDIGITAPDAESTLVSFCSLAQKWKCVLLLDEADVFLAKREKGDLVRNSLVSVFLRVLEYYSGVIILTTNRVGEFDEAFRSRIHISLYFPKLTQSSTKEIWEKNIARLKTGSINIDVEEDKILRFIDKDWELNKSRPSRRWNGRQIKNAFQTAVALARWDFYENERSKDLKRPLLRAAHFNRVAQTSAHFDDYIRDVHGFREEDDSYGIIAERDEIRRDSNIGTIPEQPILKPVRHQTGSSPGAGAYGSSTTRCRGHDLFDDIPSDSDEDDENILQLKLKLARAKRKKGLAVEAFNDEDEAW
ncbi:hypothetical protein B0H63DRAFT_442499 [Podospora didyma]|uniref:AAA+ ATPase domain-containing protein n=1 Tax=Podospora didyma TaxID=330526 RepID=A0AAE0K168_9PEZI|nr:hypothetical protein B0H63DRAFT_442499 [Podospora didyma]